MQRRPLVDRGHDHADESIFVKRGEARRPVDAAAHEHAGELLERWLHRHRIDRERIEHQLVNLRELALPQRTDLEGQRLHHRRAR
jgi:hypothetical protein